MHDMSVTVVVDTPYSRIFIFLFFFFFNDTATTEIYTLSLHDALPILHPRFAVPRTYWLRAHGQGVKELRETLTRQDRKSTRLNSSHSQISYAVFCLKKKKKTTNRSTC